jgi:hypothetical protein
MILAYNKADGCLQPREGRTFPIQKTVDYALFSPSVRQETKMKKTRRTIDSTLKAKVALEAVRGEKSIAELAEQHGLHPNQIYAWKKQLENYAVYVFDWPIREITQFAAKLGDVDTH